MSHGRLAQGLFYGDGLGEVAGFVDIAAAFNSDVIGEELHGDGGESCLIDFVGFGNLDNGVNKAIGEVLSGIGEGDDGAFARFDFLDIGEGFLENFTFEGDGYGGALGADEGNGAVLHFGSWVSLCVNVGNLLKFQSALQSDREHKLPTEEEEVIKVGKLFSDGGDEVGLVEDLGDKSWGFAEGAGDEGSFREGKVPHAAEV